MTDEPGEPGVELDAARLRWLIRDDLDRCLRSSKRLSSVPEREAPGTIAAWFATFLPLLFTEELRQSIRDGVAASERSPGHSTHGWYRLLPLYAARVALDADPAALGILVANLDHAGASIRPLVYRSVAFVVDDLRFHDVGLQRKVENCLLSHNVDADHAAVLLLAAPGRVEDKRRWAASQLVRHGGLSRRTADVLEAAAESLPVPNTMLGPMTRATVHLAARLAAVGGDLPFPGAEGSPDDWAQRDLLHLGRDLWPQLLYDRVAGHPLFQASLDLLEREQATE